jgi:hypothetical protein
VSTQNRAPNQGMPKARSIVRLIDSSPGGAQHASSYYVSVHTGQGKLPKMQFPVFNGEDPQLWRSRCESYFDMYGVELSLWVQVASMHLEGLAARWLQSVERRLKHANWHEFCSLIHDRFGRDQHDALIHQLFHMRQEGFVTEYVDQFSALVGQLSAYESKANLLYYAMRFVDGLREKIKSMVMI